MEWRDHVFLCLAVSIIPSKLVSDLIPKSQKLGVIVLPCGVLESITFLILNSNFQFHSLIFSFTSQKSQNLGENCKEKWVCLILRSILPSMAHITVTQLTYSYTCYLYGQFSTLGWCCCTLFQCSFSLISHHFSLWYMLFFMWVWIKKLVFLLLFSVSFVGWELLLMQVILAILWLGR